MFKRFGARRVRKKTPAAQASHAQEGPAQSLPRPPQNAGGSEGYYETLLHNIEIYDGTERGQQSIAAYNG